MLIPRMTEAVIAGVDEVGRGALAGPVVAAACVCSRETWREMRPRIADSKMLSPEEREEMFALLTARCPWGVGFAAASIVDQEGILTATETAMQEAVLALSRTLAPTYLLIDGRDKFWFDLPHSSIIRGDQTEECIAAASIIAKVVRDRFMGEQDALFPAYGFAEHKGYGTPLHFHALGIQGPCPLHRRTFLGMVTHVPTTPSGAFSR